MIEKVNSLNVVVLKQWKETNCDCVSDYFLILTFICSHILRFVFRRWRRKKKTLTGNWEDCELHTLRLFTSSAVNHHNAIITPAESRCQNDSAESALPESHLLLRRFEGRETCFRHLLYLNDSDDPLTFHLAPPKGPNISVLKIKIATGCQSSQFYLYSHTFASKGFTSCSLL